ncbi:SDR family oxidoreductase [Chitinilyticum piscinae]|uniref:SDR family oxidoreductase n=1 Tax=Chitinilyticum piscinae TaxID=2866724 RepID=A0A8J7G0Z8_9NEIS|nr:SDR family oxidoreductase [Chitinilyticum piscinae]MBE9609980.1 SDR family oxidoreductase [Chitinilyticum piscinae]
MRVLVCGASGLIGAALVGRLLERGHRPVLLQRRPAPVPVGCEAVAGDFARVASPADCLPWLEGVDAVVNAVGIFRESAGASFAQIHQHAPACLFEACAQAGVRRVVQVSALGAAPDAVTEYWRSKGRAEQVLQARGLDWRIVRPSLVLADDGRSSRQFAALASLPLLPDLAGCRPVQPVLLADVVDALLELIENDAPPQRCVDAVGPQALGLGEYLALLRRNMGLPKARVIRVSALSQNWTAAIGQYLPGCLLGPESLAMLRQGCAADVAGLRALLRREPGACRWNQPDAVRLNAQLRWLLPIMRLALASVWLGTAAVSLWGWPREASYQLLGATGVPAAVQPLVFYGAVALDTVFGVASVVYPRRGLWLAQGSLVLGYSAIIALRLPEFLLHPFGPLLKNLPVLALCLLLAVLGRTNSQSH